MTQKILNQKLASHRLWLEDETQGERLTLVDIKLIGLCFDHVLLDKAVISNVTFRHCKFNAVRAILAKFTNVTIDFCYITNSVFYQTSIYLVTVKNCQLTATTFNQIESKELRFLRILFTKSRFINSLLKEIVFHRCQIVKGRFIYSFLPDCCFIKTTFSDPVWIHQCDLPRALFLDTTFGCVIPKIANLDAQVLPKLAINKIYHNRRKVVATLASQLGYTVTDKSLFNLAELVYAVSRPGKRTPDFDLDGDETIKDIKETIATMVDTCSNALTGKTEVSTSGS